jgi:TPR repeat protein
MLADGRGMARDEAKAQEWFAKALLEYRQQADRGVAAGLHNVGQMYDLGYGVAKDEKAAAEWYRKAIAAGDAATLLTLGRLHAEGRGGVPKSEAEARGLFRKAAKASEVAQVWANVQWLLDWSDFGLSRPPFQTVALMLLTLAEMPKHRELLLRNAGELPEPVRIAVQKRLKQAGHYSGPLNGEFGANMKAALAGWAATQTGASTVAPGKPPAAQGRSKGVKASTPSKP